MKMLNIHEAKTHLSSVLADVVDKGEEFVICKSGRPVADLVPHRRKSRLIPHSSLRKIIIKYDPTEELSLNEWPAEDR